MLKLKKFKVVGYLKLFSIYEDVEFGIWVVDFWFCLV